MCQKNIGGSTQLQVSTRPTSKSPARKTADSFKKKTNRDFGIRTPLLLRLMILLGYVEIARRGAMLLYHLMFADTSSTEPPDFEGMKESVVVFTTVYTIETAFAVCWRWISMQGIDMRDMYEHHGAGTVAGIACTIYLQSIIDANEQEPGLLAKLIPLPLAVSLFGHLCEILCVVRTLVPNPDGTFFKGTQHIIGIVLITSESVIGVHAFLSKYLYERLNTLDKIHASELVVVPLFLYLNVCLQPVYTWKNLKGLKRMIMGGTHRVSKPGKEHSIPRSKNHMSVLVDRGSK